MKKFIFEISRINSLIHSLNSFGLSVVYTVGHIIIAWICATLIFNADFLMASADATIEPIINGFWFYLLHKYAHNKLKPGSLAVIYTIGHFLIATTWSFMILGFELQYAALDAVIEPLLNGFWFYFLMHFWSNQEVSEVK
ncbi:MAG: hypothetical protein P8J74_05695 [Woeseiaceae bacterium]|nr:hypothetical protein [Woeseiaceae bacterium]